MNLQFSNLQGPDSQWNSNFGSYAEPNALLILASSPAFISSNVTLTYNNGQEKTAQSFATIRAGIDFTGISSGEDVYSKFLNLNTTIQAPNTTSIATRAVSGVVNSSNRAAAPAATIPGYPLPIVRDNGANKTSGYFLNGTGYDDTGVISVLSFNAPTGIEPTAYLNNFQTVVASLLS